MLTLDQVLAEVAGAIAHTPTKSEVRSALAAARQLHGNYLLAVEGNSYVWTPDGQMPQSAIPDRVARMMRLRRDGHTLEAISQQSGVTRERVRQLLKAYGGPTASEVREAAARRAEQEERAMADRLRNFLVESGPVTVDDAAAETGLAPQVVSRVWPHDLAYLRLHSAGHIEPQWTDDEILNSIREAALYDHPLTTTAYSELVSVGEIRGPSIARVGQRFGSWSAACEAAGVEPGPTHRDNYDSRWSDDDILRVVRAYLLDPDAPNSFHRFDEWKRSHAPDGPSGPTVRNRLGPWSTVKRRALGMETSK